MTRVETRCQLCHDSDGMFRTKELTRHSVVEYRIQEDLPRNVCVELAMHGNIDGNAMAACGAFLGRYLPDDECRANFTEVFAAQINVKTLPCVCGISSPYVSRPQARGTIRPNSLDEHHNHPSLADFDDGKT